MITDNPKMKTYWMILIIILSLFCLPMYSQEYFPLEIGNEWFYELSTWNSNEKDTLSFGVIGDTLMPNGINYYVLSKSMDPAQLLSPFVRADSAFIYFYDTSDSIDTPVYDFNAPLGEFYQIGLYASENDSPRVQLSYIDTTQIFGEQSNIISFYLDWLVPFDLTFSQKFGPLGWYSAHHEPIWTNLIGCIISGKNYGAIVGVSEFSSQFLDYRLAQNYPNPFNPSTRIEFSIPKSSYVKLDVFDTLGRKIKELLNQNLSAGSYSVNFDSNGIFKRNLLLSFID